MLSTIGFYGLITLPQVHGGAIVCIVAASPEDADELVVPASIVGSMLQHCEVWLGTPSVSQQLVAVGYYPLGLQQAAAEALAAWDDAKQDMSNSSRRGTLVQKLQAAGAALASVALRCVCNNPWCGNVGGATELGIVSGKGHKCNGCRAAYYCSPPGAAGPAASVRAGRSTSQCVRHWQLPPCRLAVEAQV